MMRKKTVSRHQAALFEARNFPSRVPEDRHESAMHWELVRLPALRREARMWLGVALRVADRHQQEGVEPLPWSDIGELWADACAMLSTLDKMPTAQDLIDCGGGESRYVTTFRGGYRPTMELVPVSMRPLAKRVGLVKHIEQSMHRAQQGVLTGRMRKALSMGATG